MTGLEVLDRIAYGQTLFHRDHDAYDLLDGNGCVAAVLCPRQSFVAVAIPARRLPPKPVGRRIPYGEKVAHRISESNLDDGAELLQQLVQAEHS